MSASRSSAAPNSSSMRALVRSSFQSVKAVDRGQQRHDEEERRAVAAK